MIELYLVNQTTRDQAKDYRLYHHRVMDVQYDVCITNGQHHPMQFSLAPREYQYEPLREVDGYGHACALIRVGQNHLRTEFMPTVHQPWIDTPSAQDVGMAQEPEFKLLSRDPLPLLNALIDAMKRYRGTWRDEVAALERQKDPRAQAAADDLAMFEDEIFRAEQGMAALREDAELMRAFQLMNETMLRAVQAQRKPFQAWRLFQIGFLLTQLPAIQERLDTQTATRPSPEAAEFADVLHFATGGGKTEAYLGIILVSILYQRLRGRRYGVSAWMRFPLRMLSVQQFQRLAYVIGQANEIKAREGLAGHPFTIGYYTGRGTPNRISSTFGEYAATYLPRIAEDPDAAQRFRFVNHCPHCSNPVRVDIRPETFRIAHVCTNAECWSNHLAPTGDYREGIRGELGIYISDEECYRYLPTALVGTLDKLAVLGPNPRFPNFFGTARYFCPDHGFSVESSCRGPVVQKNAKGWGEMGTCPNNSRTSTVRTVPVAPLIDPGFPLLINDELHLLGEDLGNFDAHYETVLAHLQRTAPGGLPPKVLAATATIRKFEHHIQHLYLLRGRRFPSGGMHLEESFYKRRRKAADETPLYRRTHVGLLPLSTVVDRVPSVVCDANEHYQALVRQMLAELTEDPSGAAARMGFAAGDGADIAEHLHDALRLSLVYAVRTTHADLAMRLFGENAAALRARGEPEPVFHRLDGQVDLGEIQEVVEKVERDDPDDPLDEIVATSVVSHGVDLARLNIVLFTGWPSSTSEYLQASSRSGRTHPGMVLVGLSYTKMFEASVFSNFTAFHHFIERLIETVPINRYAPNVLERTLPGAFNALVLNWVPRQPWGAGLRHEALSLSEALNSDSSAIPDFTEELVRAFRFDQARALGVFNSQQLDAAEAQLRDQARRMVGYFRRVADRHAKKRVSEVLAKLGGYPPTGQQPADSSSVKNGS